MTILMTNSQMIVFKTIMTNILKNVMRKIFNFNLRLKIFTAGNQCQFGV